MIKPPRIPRRSDFRAGVGYGKTLMAFEIYKHAMNNSIGNPLDPSKWSINIPDGLDCPTVPHWDNPHFVFDAFAWSPYFDEIFERLGRERYVLIGGAIYARDDEALAMWTLAFDEIEAEKSIREYRMMIQ